MAESFATTFAEELTRIWTPIQSQRWEESASRIFLAEPSRLERWGLINGDAAASYNGILRTLVLQPDMIERGPKGNGQIAAMSTLIQRHGPAAISRAATITHELAHAEYSLMVTEKVTREDAQLVAVFETEILPWLKRRTKSYQILWPRIAASEVFAYFRGDLIMFFQEELEKNLNANGLSAYNQTRCFKLKRHQENRFLFEPENRTPYRHSVALSGIWVLGQELNLPMTGADPFLPRWRQALWDHFEALFAPPRSRQEFVDWLNRNPYWRGRLNACAEKPLL